MLEKVGAELTRLEAPAERVTLRLRRPLGRTCLWALLVLLAMVTGAEAACRLPALQRHLPRPSLGTGHRQFEIQWARFHSFVEREGAPDCILLGNSIVRTGLDPEVVSTAHQAETGAPLRCFNFGVDGLDAPTAASLAELVVQKARPRLLIVGVTTLGNGRASMAISSSPWFQAQLGRPSLDGWLLENSRAYRYYLLLLDWLKTPDFWEHDRRLEAHVEALGFNRVTRVLQNPGEAPDLDEEARFFQEVNMQSPLTEEEYEAYYAAVDRIVQLRDRVQIVAIETPLHPTFLLYFEGGERQYAGYMERVEQHLDREGIEFWRTMGVLNLPDADWQDRAHLNVNGAQLFSQWLGQRVAQAVEQGLLANPTR